MDAELRHRAEPGQLHQGQLVRAMRLCDRGRASRSRNVQTRLKFRSDRRSRVRHSSERSEGTDVQTEYALGLTALRSVWDRHGKPRARPGVRGQCPAGA